ncbi:MAG TPA: hypothetical protein VF382_02710, partial [Actinomycetota bacterium]
MDESPEETASADLAPVELGEEVEVAVRDAEPIEQELEAPEQEPEPAEEAPEQELEAAEPA